MSVVEGYQYQNNQNPQIYSEKGISKSENQHSLKNIFNNLSPININKDFDPTFRP
jgi:hypothetical protein